MNRELRLAASTLLLAVSLVACGAAPPATSTPTATPTLTPTATATMAPTPSPEPSPTPSGEDFETLLLASARQAMGDIESFRWEGEFDRVNPADAQAVRFKTEGVWSGGDVYYRVFDARTRDQLQENIYVAGRSFRRTDGEWQELPSFDPSGIPAWGDHSPVPELENPAVIATQSDDFEVVGSRFVELPGGGYVDYSHTLVVRRVGNLLASAAFYARTSDGDIIQQSVSIVAYNRPGDIAIPDTYHPLPGPATTPGPTPVPTSLP